MRFATFQSIRKLLALILCLSLFYCTPPNQAEKNRNRLLFQLLLLSAYLNNFGPDPLYGDQWHLKNTGSTFGSVAGEDANVEPVWNQGIWGQGVRVVVLDDGVDLLHEDLAPNVDRGLSIDFTGVLPNLVNGTAGCNANVCHGTAVAGIIAARDNNGKGGRGAAPRASLAGRNVLFNATNSNIARATSNQSNEIAVSNNSWGAPDQTGNPDGSLATSEWRSAVDTALANGRNGRGTLFFWSAGNGGKPFPNSSLEIDNSNQDGQANYYGVMSICAVGNDGKRAYYSEQGANLWVCAPSEGNTGVAITTTDMSGELGYNNSSKTSDLPNRNYTKTFNGTSAAAPLAAGVGALVLQANPNLTWRDARLILAKSARKVDSNDTTDATCAVSCISDWRTNGAGIPFNHKYGFGVVDANAAVNLSRNWSNVGPEILHTSGAGGSVGPAANYGISGYKRGTVVLKNNINTSNLTVTTSSPLNLSSTGIGKIEFVEVYLSSSGNPGDLFIELESPSGTTAMLQVPHPCFPSNSVVETACSNFSNWRFGVSNFLDEPANGNWTLRIADGASGTSSANPFGLSNPTVNHTTISTSVTSWSLRIRGRAN